MSETHIHDTFQIKLKKKFSTHRKTFTALSLKKQAYSITSQILNFFFYQ